MSKLLFCEVSINHKLIKNNKHYLIRYQNNSFTIQKKQKVTEKSTDTTTKLTKHPRKFQKHHTHIHPEKWL